ncbi:carboxypeptidase-like regulatory domain-containing protein [Marinilabiliaceae bacterium JC017]|nr:carboxypeptidase-like regulatory domain-containing protein [Marinilabiliaceae bacterium JC017]
MKLFNSALTASQKTAGYFLLKNFKPETKSQLKNILTSILLLFATPGIAASFKGQIRDAKTNETIPFVNVIIQNTTIGTMSDLDGNFTLTAEKVPCTLYITLIGYKPQKIRIEKEDQPLEILLEEDVYSLNEVVVKPDNSYERSLLRKVIKSRNKNNPANFKVINYDDYTRTTVFLTNLGIKTAQSGTFKKSTDAFVKNSDSTVMMPFFMDETITNHQRDKENKIDLSRKTSQKSDGILSELNTQINNVLNKKLTTEFNFYDNQINILSRGFPSPISSTALLYYNIYLNDSTVSNNTKYYKFEFYPKSYKNITFKGHFWVEENSWALTEIKASLPNSANLNFVKDLEVFIDYKKTGQNQWFYNSQKINLQLTLRKKESKDNAHKSFAIQKLICYQDINTTSASPTLLSSVTDYHPDTEEPGDAHILRIRQESAPLDSFEQSAYQGIQTLKANKFIKVADKFSAMTINGYYNMNKLDLGPYFSFYRKNEIEGDRFTLPLRTSEKLFKNFMIGGYLGYGFKNKEFAHGGDLKYQLPVKKRTILSTGYHYDYFDLTRNKFIEFIRENPYNQGGGNIISAFTSAVPNPYIMRNRHVNITLEHQFNKSIGILIRPSLNRYYSNYNLPFTSQGINMSHFNTRNLMLDLRLSFSQDYDEGFFSRIYYGNQKPVFHLSALLGSYEVPLENGNKNGLYANFNLSMKNRVNLGPAFLKLLIEGGYILGDVPYPLLHLPRGTRDIGYARYHFNLLHHTSFASDLYINTHLSFNGGGILLNKIPLINKLNLRETVTYKAFYGKLLGNHSSVMDLPGFVQPPTAEPYMEMGVGITNIFKCLRVEYVNRLNKADTFNNFSSSHGIRFRLEVTF